jgi:hypothetical protein
MPVEDSVGFFFVFGNLFGGTFRWHYIGAEYGLCYLFCVFYPIIIVADAWTTGKWKIIALGILAVALRYFVYMYGWLFDMFGVTYALTSPMMTAVPIWLFGNLAWFIASFERSRAAPDEQELLPGAMHK